LERPAREQRSLGSRWTPRGLPFRIQLLARSTRLDGVRSGKAAETRLEAISRVRILKHARPNAVDPIGQGESMPARPERDHDGIAPEPAGFGDSTVVLADRMDQAEVDGRRSSNRTIHDSGHGEGDWVQAIGRTMAGDAGRERREPDVTRRNSERGSQGAAAKPRGGGGWSRIYGRESDHETSDRGQPRSGRLDRTSSTEGTRGAGSSPR
jgi:hypothetical protein